MALLLADDACFLDRRVEWGTLAVVFHEKKVAWGTAFKSRFTNSSVFVVVSRTRDVLLDGASQLTFNLALRRRMEDCILVLWGFHKNILAANTLKRRLGAELPQPVCQILTWSWRRCASYALGDPRKALLGTAERLHICSPQFCLEL